MGGLFKIQINLAIGIFLIFIFAMSFFSAYWSESISVHVLSKDGLPISGAKVSVVYQSKDCYTHSEISKYTDYSGTANFSFLNLVEEGSDPACLEKSYNILAEFGGYHNSTIGFLSNSDKNYSLWLPYIMHILKVVDAVNKPVSGAEVVSGNLTFSSDSAGNAYILLPVGISSAVTVIYGEVSKTVSINPSLSSVSNVSLPIYDLIVSLFDENGNTLQGNITYGTKIKEITKDYVVFEKFSDLNPTFLVTVDGTTKSISSKVTSNTLSIYYDTVAPVISSVQSGISNGKLVVSALFTDPGRYPSGIDGYPSISYRTNMSESAEVKMYPSGSGKYEGSIPLESQNDINYTIIVRDVQGNVNTYSDVQTFSFKPEVEIEKATRGFSWITAIGIFVFAIVIYVIYQKIREQAN